MADPLDMASQIRDLVDDPAGPYLRVPPDAAFAVRLLEDVTSSELDLVMVATARGIHLKTVTLAYDGARKAVQAIMLAMGVRVSRGEGEHRAIVEFAETEFARTPAEQRDSRGFATARIVRNAEEYPRPADVERSEAELRALAQSCVRLVGHARSRLGLEPRDDLVPTDSKVAAYLGH